MSVDCNSSLLWFYITTLSDWLKKKLASLFQPIGSKTEVKLESNWNFIQMDCYFCGLAKIRNRFQVQCDGNSVTLVPSYFSASPRLF